MENNTTNKTDKEEFIKHLRKCINDFVILENLIINGGIKINNKNFTHREKAILTALAQLSLGQQQLLEQVEALNKIVLAPVVAKNNPDITTDTMDIIAKILHKE